MNCRIEVSLNAKQPKALIGCNQRVSSLGETVITSVSRRYCTTGIQAAPKSFVKVFMWNVAMSYHPPAMKKAAREGCRWCCVDGRVEKANAVM